MQLCLDGMQVIMNEHAEVYQEIDWLLNSFSGKMMGVSQFERNASI